MIKKKPYTWTIIKVHESNASVSWVITANPAMALWIFMVICYFSVFIEVLVHLLCCLSAPSPTSSSNQWVRADKRIMCLTGDNNQTPVWTCKWAQDQIERKDNGDVDNTFFKQHHLVNWGWFQRKIETGKSPKGPNPQRNSFLFFSIVTCRCSFSSNWCYY